MDRETCRPSGMGEDGLGSVYRAPLAAAAYSTDAYFARECEKIFGATWVFVGFLHELKEEGDAVPVEIGRFSLLLVRGRREAIHVFHNICRHRCARLVDAPGNLGRVIRCPYHGWVYGLDGKLRTAPHFGGPGRQFPPDFDPGDFALREVRFALWHDWIFVDLSGRAPDFESYAAPIKRRLAGLSLTELTPIGSLDFGEVACNWKFLMENFIEPYHVQFVHATTTAQPLLDHYLVEDGACLGSAVDLAEGDGEGAGAAKLDVSSRYLTLFPNFVLGWYVPDQLGVHLNLPVSAGATRQRRVLYHRDADSLSRASIDEIKALWHKVHKEDHWICEKLQKGWSSPAAARQGSVLSPHWETTLRRFQEFVLSACGEATG